MITTNTLQRAQHLLRLAFSHVQITLYKPFLHYISQSCMDNFTSNQCYAYAAACVDVGRNTIYNARQMEKKDILAGPYWFSIYTTFCATLTLAFHVWENAEVENALEIIKDAEYGRHVLTRLAYQSTAAESLSETLGVSLDSEAYHSFVGELISRLRSFLHGYLRDLGMTSSTQG